MSVVENHTAVKHTPGLK